MTLNFEITTPDFKIPRDVQRVLDAMGTRRFVVSMTPVFGQRTTRQNALFHLLVNRIALGTGCSKEEAKDAIKAKAVEMGYPPQTDTYGRLVLDKNKQVVPKPSHEASVHDMQTLIEAAYYVASENGIDIDYVEQQNSDVQGTGDIEMPDE